MRPKRNRTRDTSRAAYIRGLVEGTIGDNRARIYHWLRQQPEVRDLVEGPFVLLGTQGVQGSGGGTCEEAEQALGLRHASASSAITYLARDLGVIRDSGRRRRTSSGRWAVVWEVASRTPAERARAAGSLF